MEASGQHDLWVSKLHVVTVVAVEIGKLAREVTDESQHDKRGFCRRILVLSWYC